VIEIRFLKREFLCLLSSMPWLSPLTQSNIIYPAICLGRYDPVSFLN